MAAAHTPRKGRVRNVQGVSLNAVALFLVEQFLTPGRQGQKPWRLFFHLKKSGGYMLVSDFITNEDRLRYDAMPDGAHKRAVARRFEIESGPPLIQIRKASL